VTGTTSNDTKDCGGASLAKTINGGVGLDSITGTVLVDTINGDVGNYTLPGGIVQPARRHRQRHPDWWLGNDTVNGELAKRHPRTAASATTSWAAASALPPEGRRRRRQPDGPCH
jgi:Ca2+-binding RTX toxin-like protein